MDPKNITIFILSILSAGFLGTFFNTGSTPGVNIENLTKHFIEETMSSEIEGLKQRVEILESFMYDEMIKLILKNAKKIVSDPSDLKRSDIDICLSYLPKLPPERKTEEVQAAIDIIVEWDLANQ